MKFEKKFIIVLIIVMILNIIFNIKFSYARLPIEDWMSDDLKNEIEEKNVKIREGQKKDSILDENIINHTPTVEETPKEVNEKVNSILGIIRVVGIIVSVIALMIIGLRTMTGSLEQKAVYKEALPGYVLGAILVAAIGWLPTLIYEMIKGI